MPGLDFEWWRINLVLVSGVGLGAGLALFVGLASRRWLELLELDRAADAHAHAVEYARERGTDPPAQTPPARILWVRLLPWIAGLAGAATLLDVLDVAPIHVFYAPVTWLMERPVVVLDGTTITSGAVIELLLVISIGRWFSIWAQRALGRRMRAQPHARAGVIASVQRLMHAGLMTIFVISALLVLGLNFRAVFAASALFAVALGFGLQSLTQNFVSGVILLVERTIKPGDVLQLDGRLVRVTELGIRATIGRTLDDDDVLIPNALLLDSVVVNYSLLSDVVRARATVGVSYAADLDHVIRVLGAAAAAFPGRVIARDPLVLLRGFGPSSVDFEVSVWLEDVFVRDVALSALRLDIWRALRAEGIVIAYPQLDVHVAPGLRDELNASTDANAARPRRAPAASTPVSSPSSGR